MIYALLGLQDSRDPGLATRPDDRQLSELTWHASARFGRKEFAETARLYRKLLVHLPTDPVARSMLAACVDVQALKAAHMPADG
jgi:hypothetical protein